MYYHVINSVLYQQLWCSLLRQILIYSAQAARRLADLSAGGQPEPDAVHPSEGRGQQPHPRIRIMGQQKVVMGQQLKVTWQQLPCHMEIYLNVVNVLCQQQNTAYTPSLYLSTVLYISETIH